MILLIDNYDSFTYNLVQYLTELGAEVRVCRNDTLRCEDVRRLAPQGIVISPGPGRPDSAGISIDVVRELGPGIPLLGVCLGHQCIAEAFGGRVGLAPRVMHGKNSQVKHTGLGVFVDVPSPFSATRYHSLAVDRSGLPDCLEVTAWTAGPDGEPAEIMGLRHRTYDIEGVQFHPEAVLTEHGHRMLGAFLRRVDQHAAEPPGV